VTAVACHRPIALAAALALLAESPDLRPLAGGQTLVAMLNLRLVEPAGLVSLGALPELRGIARQPDGGLRIGAMTTHAELAECTACTEGLAILRDTARQIADPAIRNAGTIGGACAHGDAVGDWPAALLAADARMELQNVRGKREVPAEAFFIDLLTTAIESGELLTAIIVPPLPGRARYRKLARVHGDYATVSVAAIGARDGDRARFVRIAIGACGPRPVRVAAAEALLAGQRVDYAQAERAGEALAAAIDPIDDVRGSAAYRRRVLPALVAETVMEVLQA
jgi:carbon-monoxide dehydrogenase medium subunit